MLLGAHKSISGSIDKSIERALADGCECLQIFVKNKNRWESKPLNDNDAENFRNALEKSGLLVCSHSSYLINPASEDETVRAKSLASYKDELFRCDTLNIPYHVIHPGAHLGLGTQRGVENAARFFDEIYASGSYKTMTLLETTSGQGTCLGHKVEEIADIIKLSGFSEKIAVCLDSCHIYSAGYDIVSDYDNVFSGFFDVFGDKIRVFHLNDTKKPLGSRVDRHELIAEGLIGESFFKRVVNDKRVAGVLGILETPVETDYKDELVKLKSYREL